MESSIDELAWKLKVDPLDLRLRNYTDKDPGAGKPFSSKSLRECYKVAAEKFAWSKRSPEPRSMRDGDILVGYGMATASYPTHVSSASALARLQKDGSILVQAGSQDLGTGTYTVMTQIAADTLGVPAERVTFELGDTDMPETPVSGGSQTAATVGSAVLLACRNLRGTIASTVVGDARSPLHGQAPDQLDFSNGKVFAKGASDGGESLSAVAQRSGQLEGRADAKPPADARSYSMHAFGAHFVEVRVDPDFGTIRVSRVVTAIAAGRILNRKTATSQILGGVVMGVGQALTEELVMDHRRGRLVNMDLAEYHVPVNADIPNIDVLWVDEDDTKVNPVGAKGVGEIGIVGVAAAVANAVYHATGVRVRDLPITLDKVLKGQAA